MKKFTLILISMLFFLVGGVFSQTQLELTGGTNRDLPSGDHPMSGKIQFRDNGIRSCLGGSAWAVSFNSGETHTFTVTLEDSDNDDCTLYLGAYREDISTNWYGSYTPIAEQSISVPATKTLTLTVSESYHGVYLYASGYKKVNIHSITRTVSAASSVAAPTISPVSGTYDGELSVTITKGEGNDKVVYSVSGATTGNIDDDEFTTDIKVLNLTGSGTITVTATGYKDNDASNVVTNTYTFGVPNGKKTITSNLPHTFNSWDGGNALHINQSEFSGMSLNDYVVLNVQDVAQDATLLGFRSNNNGWQESPFVNCTTVSRGNGAKGEINKGETLWWLKASNNDVVNAFTGHEVIMQGGMLANETNSSVTLNSIDIYKSFTVSEGVDNTISSKENNVVVELTRSFVKDTWNTVCLPFTLTSAQATQLFGSGYQLTQFTSVSGTTMQFTTTDSFVAGVPYLVKPTIDVSNASPVVLVDVDITAKTPQTVTYEGYSFVGNFTQKTFSGDECNTSRFVATGNELKKPNNNSTLKSLRCYFTVPATAAARSLSFDVDEEGNTTAVANINRETITNNGDFFNLAGQRVAKPTKGLYIVNGKKVVIK